MRKITVLTLSALLLTGSITANAKVENFYEVRQHLTSYYKSGEYINDISKVTDKAKKSLARAIKKKKLNA